MTGILGGIFGFLRIETDFELIESVVLNAATASVTFDSLSVYADRYRHLQLRVAVRAANNLDRSLNYRINGDTGLNYYNHYLQGAGTTVSGLSYNPQDRILGTGTSTTASAFTVQIMDINDAFSTTKTKVTKALSNKPGANVAVISNLWNSTDAINSIECILSSNAAVGSRFSLYGIRA